MRTSERKDRAFSLVEALVVVALIALLVGLAAPLWAKQIDRAAPERAAATLQEAVRTGMALAWERGEGCRVVVRRGEVVVLPPQRDVDAGAGSVDDGVLWRGVADGWRTAGSGDESEGARGITDSELRIGEADGAVVPEAVEIVRIGSDGVLIPARAQVEVAGRGYAVRIERFTGRVALEPVGQADQIDATSHNGELLGADGDGFAGDAGVPFEDDTAQMGAPEVTP